MCGEHTDIGDGDVTCNVYPELKIINQSHINKISCELVVMIDFENDCKCVENGRQQMIRPAWNVSYDAIKSSVMLAGHNSVQRRCR